MSINRKCHPLLWNVTVFTVTLWAKKYFDFRAVKHGARLIQHPSRTAPIKRRGARLLTSRLKLSEQDLKHKLKRNFRFSTLRIHRESLHKSIILLLCSARNLPSSISSVSNIPRASRVIYLCVLNAYTHLNSP